MSLSFRAGVLLLTPVSGVTALQSVRFQAELSFLASATDFIRLN